MSKTPTYGPSFQTEDVFQQILEGAAKLLFWVGLLATLISTGFLVYTYIAFSGQSTGSVDQAASNIQIFQKVLIVGLLAAGVGSTYLFWGEETLGAFQLILAILYFCAPLYIPIFNSKVAQNLPTAAASALDTLKLSGEIFGIFAIVVLIADITVRIRLRAVQGAKADQLKYGKGVKEEIDIKNVFMGKCWQLPFCRKFVRERCPIYHANRTCWREKVGCMCEEEVIRNAMANKAIPKDASTAVNFIPYNNKLPLVAKMQRCKQCVIYNEHQKHKYRLALPCVVVGYGVIIAVFFEPLMRMMSSLITRIDKIVKIASYQNPTSRNIENVVPVPFQVIMLCCIVIVLLAYTVRVVEYLIFKAKL